MELYHLMGNGRYIYLDRLKFKFITRGDGLIFLGRDKFRVTNDHIIMIFGLIEILILFWEEMIVYIFSMRQNKYGCWFM